MTPSTIKPAHSGGHTPGPWGVNRQANVLKGADGSVVCGLNGVVGWDIHLISAAPELLAALKGALGALEQDLDTGRDYGDADWEGIALERLEAAKVAIAKATGAA